MHTDLSNHSVGNHSVWKAVSAFQTSKIPQPSREYTFYFAAKDTQIYAQKKMNEQTKIMKQYVPLSWCVETLTKEYYISQGWRSLSYENMYNW